MQLTAPRNHQLDGLRGYAAIAVVVYHAILGADPTLIARSLGPSLQNIDGGYERLTKIALAMFNGDTAVVVFFIMSGAVLFASLMRETIPVAVALPRFALRRILRIYPTLIIYLIVALIVFPAFGIPASLEQFLINLSLYDFPLNGATWTLNVEMLAAPFIFVGYLFYRRWGSGGLLAVVIAMLLLLKIRVVAGGLIYFSQFAFCFALGMLIPTRLGATVARYLPAASWVAFLLVMIFAKHIRLIGGNNTATTIQQVSAALLVTLLYYDKAGRLGVFLRKTVSAFLGRISYTFYVFNVLFLTIVNSWLRSQTWATTYPLETGLCASFVIITVTIPTAYLVTLLIEEPAIRLGKRLTTAKRLKPSFQSVSMGTPSDARSCSVGPE